MAALFESDLTQISGPTDTTISAQVVDGGEAIEFNIGDSRIQEYINGEYLITRTSDTGIYRLESTFTNIINGENIIKFEVDTTETAGVIDFTLEWSVTATGAPSEITDNADPSYEGDIFSAKFYSHPDDLYERVKYYFLDFNAIAYIDTTYEYVDGTTNNRLVLSSSDPMCIDLTDGSKEISKIVSVRVSYTDESIQDEEIPELANFDLLNDSVAQSNRWPGECVDEEINPGQTGGGEPSPDESLGDVAEYLKVIADALSKIANNGITVKPEPTEEWAFNRAATVNALREAQQLENVFNEMTNPTKYPDAGYKSESELNSKPDEFFRPQSESFDPSYEDRSCPFDPISPEDLEPTEEPTDGNNGGEEESCHPPY